MVLFTCRISRPRCNRGVFTLLAVALLASAGLCRGADKPAPAPDVLVLANGDTLHGKLVSVVDGKVTFHSDPLGDLALDWDKIKELHTAGHFAVLDKSTLNRRKSDLAQLPTGKVDVEHETLTVRLDDAKPVGAPIPAKNAQYLLDESTLRKDVLRTPGFFSAWNGAATLGATLVTATQHQYTVAGGVGLVRVSPPVSWRSPSNRMSADFTGSFGKITQPGYVADGVYVAETETKSAIYHADAERDQYFSPRFYGLGQIAFDHNYSQDLDLQQIYGGGVGWTVLKSPKQEADVKATVQYEKQQFITGSTGNENLVGSTFAVNYLLHLKLFTYVQGVSFIPSYNEPRAYSANETNSFAFPAYKNLSFSVGTMDSYLNNPPASTPPTKRNSFQFTMGLTYAIKSRY